MFIYLVMEYAKGRELLGVITEGFFQEGISISEGWIRVEAGKSKDRFGNPMTMKLQGKVEPSLPE